MSAKTIIAGLIWLAIALFSLLGLLSLFVMSVIEPTFFSYWYISLISVPYTFILLILSLALAIGLFLRKKWSFKLGVAVPLIDIVMGILLSVILFMIPNIVPKSIEADVVSVGVAGTAIIAIIEIAALVLVLKSKNELIS